MTAAGPTTSIRRRTLPGRHHPQLRCSGGGRQGRHGRQDARSAEGRRRRISTRLEAPRSSTRARSTAVEGVSLMEFGTPEAMRHLAVTDFPGIVTMDAHGNSLHKDIEQESAKELAALA